MYEDEIRDIVDQLKDLLKDFHSTSITQSELARTLCELRNRIRSDQSQYPDVVIREYIALCLDEMEETQAESAQILRERFVEGLTFRETIQRLKLSVSEAQYFVKQNNAVRQLAELIQKRQEVALVERARTMRHLPSPTYTRLFGVDEHLDKMDAWLRDRERFWVIMVDGLGGMGKTALVRECVKRFGEQSCYFDGVIWATAQRERFFIRRAIDPDLTLEHLLDTIVTQLDWHDMRSRPLDQKKLDVRLLLKENPHLIVFDNLDTAEEFVPIVNELMELANPSKILLTSRIGLSNFAQVTNIHLTGLDPTDTAAFARYYAEQRGYELSGDNTTLTSLWNVTRGNPLAIMLIISQLNIITNLETILDDLVEGANEKFDGYYRFIYLPLWHKLTPEAQELCALMATIVLPEGDTREAIQAMTGFDNFVFNNALEELIRCSLVYVVKSTDPPQYAMHPLTRSFGESMEKYI
jgi:hypothetical protein